MASTIGILKKEIASFMGHTAASTTRYLPADFVMNGTDLLLIALNNARRIFEKIWDFKYCETEALLTISASPSGGVLSAATDLSSVAILVKRVQDVLLPIAVGYVPVEFTQSDNYLSRLRAQVGRQIYSATATPEEVGISETNALATLQGQTIFLTPESMFSFPVSARLSIVRFMPDYTADGDHDFFVDIAPEALKWYAVVELNRLVKQFSVMPSEGDVTEPMDLAQMAFEGLVRWDMSLSKGTSTPDAEMPQLPRPAAQKKPQ